MLLPNAPASGAWLQQTHIQEPGEQLSVVEFLFAPAYIETVWSREPDLLHQTRETRGQYDFDDQERILLAASVALDGASMMVRASLVPAKKRDRFHMRVEVAAPQIITRRGRLILFWDGHEYSVPLRVGVMLFEEISPPNFSRLKGNLPSRRLRLRLEFDTRGKNGNH